MSKTSGNLALQEKKVIVIEFAKRPETQKLRVVAYCRVSSDSSDQMNSFAAQLSHYTALISGKGTWTMTDIYADAGISGTSATKRPDFQRLLTDCRKGEVDKILVKSISRFARNTKECLEIIRELKPIGVSVCFEEQGIDTANMTGELLTAVFTAIAQKESESISGNMRWSYKHRMQSGTFLPSAMPFGYKIKDRKIVVDEAQAEIICRIFRDYLAGQSMDDIAAQLNRENIKDCIWRHSAVSYILSNEHYIGNSLWQKTYATDTLPAKQVKNRSERAQYYVEDTHPPIIGTETFLAVQALKERRGEIRRTYQRTENPLHQIIICGNCGTKYIRKVGREKIYWVCRKHDRDKNACPSDRIPEDEIHATFLRIYHKLRLHGEPILKQLISNLQVVREKRMLWSMDIFELNKRISDITDQERMLADMNKLGLVDPDIFISQSNLLAQQLQAVKREKERILASEKDDTIPKTQELLETLSTLPEFLPSFDGEIFTELVEQIKADDTNTLRFRLKNGLALTATIERGLR